LKPGEFVHSFGDAHLYLNHIEQAELQLTRSPFALPRMHLNPGVKDISDSATRTSAGGYQAHPHIAAAVARFDGAAPRDPARSAAGLRACLFLHSRSCRVREARRSGRCDADEHRARVLHRRRVFCDIAEFAGAPAASRSGSINYSTFRDGTGSISKICSCAPPFGARVSARRCSSIWPSAAAPRMFARRMVRTRLGTSVDRVLQIAGAQAMSVDIFA